MNNWMLLLNFIESAQFSAGGVPSRCFFVLSSEIIAVFSNITLALLLLLLVLLVVLLLPPTTTTAHTPLPTTTNVTTTVALKTTTPLRRRQRLLSLNQSINQLRYC